MLRNREAVIDAALEVLAARPEASIEEVAAAAGLGRTTVYRHFATREDLLRSLFGRVVAESREVTAAVIARGGSAEDTLLALGPAIVGIGQRFRFLHGHQALAAEVLEAERGFERDPVRVFLELGIANGELRDEMPLSWMQATIQSLAVATTDEINADRLEPEAGGRILGEMLAAALLGDRARR